MTVYNKKTDGRYASPSKSKKPIKKTDGRYASPSKSKKTIKKTDGRYAPPSKPKKNKNNIRDLPRGLRIDTTTGLGANITLNKKRPKKIIKK